MQKQTFAAAGWECANACTEQKQPVMNSILSLQKQLLHEELDEGNHC